MLNAGGLVVDTPSPDAFCPALEQTRSIVAARLGAVELEGLWHASYVLVHRPAGDFVVLTLLDPDGALRLTRDFPVQEGSCSTASQVIALVLERYFSSSDAPQDNDAIDTRPRTNASLAHSESKASDSEEHPAPTITTKQPKEEAHVPGAIVARSTSMRSHRMSVAIGGLVTLDWVAPTLNFGVGISARQRLELGIGYDLSDHERAFGEGTVGLNRVPLHVTFAQGVYRINGLRVEVGGGMLGLFERGWTRGLVESGAETRFVPGLEALVTAHFLSEKSRISPYLGGIAGVSFEELTSRFDVDRVEVFAPARWLLGAQLGLRLRI